jgi:AraC-like DNA-binding protein
VEPLGRRNRILHVPGGRRHFWQGTGCLSIKTFAGGRAFYRTGLGSCAVDDAVYLVLNEGQPYSITVESESPVESFCVFVRDGLADEVHRSLREPAARLLDDPGRPTGPALRFFERTYPRDRAVSPALARLRAAYLRPHEAGRLDERLRELVERLLAAHAAASREADALPALRASTREELYRRLHRARDYAVACLERPLTLEELAGVACLSPNHFLRTFKQLFARTPHQFLTDKRLERACSWLAHGGRPVAEVAAAAGFESLGSFSWLFRRRVGLAPTEYRRRAQKGDFREAPPRPAG